MEFLYIGNVKIKKTAALAPMASVADRAFRTLCKKFGAAYVTGEMASSKGLCYSDRKTAELLEVSQNERPMAVQLFGDDPDFMARAAVKCSEYKPDIIDINMGCPVPKVAGNGCGSALMKRPETASDIVKAVSQAVDIPVTVKIRKGWDDNNINAVEFAGLMEKSGAKAIAVHGRTRAQMYHGKADWEIIKQVKRSVSVPVLGNGDVTDAKSCAEMYEQTGCDLVMIGRGAYGNPWIFRQIDEYLSSGKILPEPDIYERMQVMISHAELICRFKGEGGLREARKHAAWYVKGLKGAAEYRRDCGKISSMEDVRKLAEKVISSNT